MQELVCEDGCDSEPTFTSLREYVYGPEYVDQFLLQINQPGATIPVVSYVLQDDNYNVVALTNASGVITRQHAFDPYGNLIARDDFPAFGQTSAPKTRLGHQGLMVERLDAPWDVDLIIAGTSTGHPGGSTASPAATPRLLYLNRNRIYDPLFARFNQRDPNETALPLQAAAASSGEGFSAPMQMLDLDSAYAGGMNLYGYQSSNPINRTDAMGFDWFEEEADEAINDRIGHAIATLGILNEGAKWAALGLQRAADVLWALTPGSGVVDAIRAGIKISSGKGSFWDLLEVSAVALPILAKSYEWGRNMYKAAGSSVRDIPLHILQRLCFTAETLVLLPDESMRVIEDIDVGTIVASWPDPAVRIMDLETDDDWLYDGCDCLKIRLYLPDSEGRDCMITLLRPTEWVSRICMVPEVDDPGPSLRTSDAAPIGSWIHLVIEEMNISGSALILSVESCPPIERSCEGKPITGTFVTSNAPTIDLYVAGFDNPLGTTESHLFYSLDRNGWIRAGELRNGERLLSKAGEIKSLASEHNAILKIVYNLEVFSYHTYFVTDAKILVHNAYTQSIKRMASHWGIPIQKIEDAIHKIKSGGSASGAWRNPNLDIDLETGNAFIEGTTEYIGNIWDYID